MKRTVAIEIVCGCSLRCTECAIGQGLVTRKKGTMPIEDFRTIVSKIGPIAKHFYLHIWGDPLIHPNISEIVKLARSYASAHISTHGMNATPEIADLLAAENVAITVSIDGLTQNIYEINRRGGNVEKAWKAAEMFANAAKRYNRRPPDVQMLAFECCIGEWDEFNKRALSIGAHPTLKPPVHVSKPILKIAKQHDTRLRASESIEEIVKSCTASLESLTILVDGTVVMCCYDSNAMLPVGNILHDDLQDIFSKLTNIRKELAAGNAPEMCKKCCVVFKRW